MRFANRTQAGQRLARQLDHLRGADAIVLGLPRGGVPVAFEVARALGAPLDVIVVRKLGVPVQPELAMGAIGEGGIRVINDDVIRRADVTEQEIAAVEKRERLGLEQQAQQFRAGRPAVDLVGRTAIVIDDGIATGSTARAACQVVRSQGAASVVLGAPVGAPETIEALGDVCDEVVCVYSPPFFMAVGSWYEDFSPVPDAEVTSLLRRAATTPVIFTTQAHSDALGSQPRDEQVEIPAGGGALTGQLVIPGGATGIVVFVHGSGSSRNSPRNRQVAAQLNEDGLATLLFDLLTPHEELDRANVFDIETLGSRLVDVTSWLRDQPGILHAPLGYFGASTGAAAALWAAAEPGAQIDAVVSRGGRPDLAGARLGEVTSPTLLIVGDRDEVVLGLNHAAQDQLRCETRLAIVPGASHLFTEPGALQTVTRLARDWFESHFGAPS